MRTLTATLTSKVGYMHLHNDEFFNAIANILHWCDRHNLPMEGLKVIIETPQIGTKYSVVRTLAYNMASNPQLAIASEERVVSKFSFMGISIEVRAVDDVEKLRNNLQFCEARIRTLENELKERKHSYQVTYPQR